MSIQSSISGAIGAIGAGVAVTKALRRTAPQSPAKGSYNTDKQQQANNLAAEQAEAKETQKRIILTNIGKWEKL